MTVYRSIWNDPTKIMKTDWTKERDSNEGVNQFIVWIIVWIRQQDRSGPNDKKKNNIKITT